MKKYYILAAALFLTPFVALAINQTVDPASIAITGGTINGTSIGLTSAASASTTLLSTNYASSTLGFFGTLTLPNIATPAGTFLAVDANGKVIATTSPIAGVTSVTGTYPVQSSGGTTPAISLAFGTTTPNIWAGLQTFTNASSTLFSSTYASSTLGFFGTLTLPNLGTSAGSFLAVNANGQVIATTSPAKFSGTLGQVNYFSGTNTAVGTSSLFIDTTGHVGVGSTTPWGMFSVQAPNISAAISSTSVYSTPGTYTWTTPAGASYVVIQAWGAGGAGSDLAAGGAGGGAGAFIASTTINNLATTYTINIGQGGQSETGGTGYMPGGNSGAGAGAGGGSTAFGTLIIACAGGGGGGNNVTGGSTAGAGASGTTGGAGGNGLTSGGGGGGCGTAGSANSSNTGGAAGTGGTTISGTSGSGSSSSAGNTNGAGASSAGVSGNGNSASGASGGLGSGGATAGSNGARGDSGGGSNANSLGAGSPGAGGGGNVTASLTKGGNGEIIITVFTYPAQPTPLIAFQAVTNQIVEILSGVVFGVNYVFQEIDQFGHLITGGPTPTCGSGCISITGDDRTMRILSGAGVTTITANFANTNTTSPACFASEDAAASPGIGASTTPTTLTLTSSASLSSKYVNIICQNSANFTF